MLNWMVSVTSDERRYNRVAVALGVVLLAAAGALTVVAWRV